MRMINQIFEYKLEIKKDTQVHKFYITTPKEYKYITRMAIIPFLDCSNGCPLAYLSVNANGNNLVKNVPETFFFIQDPIDVDALRKSGMKINIKASQNVFELIWDTKTPGYEFDGQLRLILWASNTPEEDYFYEGRSINIAYSENYFEEKVVIPDKYKLQRIALSGLNDKYYFDLSIQDGASLVLDKVWTKIFAFKAQKDFDNKFEKVIIEANEFYLMFHRSAGTGTNSYSILMLMKKDDYNRRKPIRRKNNIPK